MRFTLIHPQLDDPTQPYHWLAYLAGQLDHNGFRCRSQQGLTIGKIPAAVNPELATELPNNLKFVERKHLLQFDKA